MTPFSAGILRHRLVIEVNAPRQDAHGQNIPSWGPHATAWASIEASTGQQLELAAANTTAAVQIYIIRLRFRDDVNVASMRLRLGKEADAPRYFTITSSFDPDGMRKETRMVVAEVVG